MNKLIGIIASTVVSTLAWCLVNFIALGTTANYTAVITVGAVSGLVIGIGSAVFYIVNPIVMGVVCTMSVFFALTTVLVSIGVIPVPAISLELAWALVVVALIGGSTGFGYKLGARV